MIPERLLIFSVGGREYAFDVQTVCEVMEPQASYPIAGAPPHYLGLINFHGNLNALVDLPLFLGLKARPLPGKVLVLDPKLAHLALRVDAVSSIVGSRAVLEAKKGEDPLTEAVLETEKRSVLLMDLEALLTGLEEGLRQPPAAPQP